MSDLDPTIRPYVPTGKKTESGGKGNSFDPTKFAVPEESRGDFLPHMMSKRVLPESSDADEERLIQTPRPRKSSNPAASDRFEFLFIILLFLLPVLTVLITTRNVGLSWDEAYYVEGTQRTIDWLKAGASSGKLPTSAEDIDEFWDASKLEPRGHPSITRFLTAAGQIVYNSKTIPFAGMRWPIAICYGLTLVLLYILTKRLYGRVTAWTTVVAYFFLPLVFGYAHFALTETPMVLMTVLVVYAFIRGLTSAWWAVATGVIFGLALATKINALYMPLILFPWAFLWYRRESLNNIYSMLFVGLVVGLDYRNSMMEPHGLFLQYKNHPTIRKFIEGGKVIEYGAKTLPEGGWFALPKRFAVDGAMLVGDSAGLVNCMRLKGIHQAVKSGMLAADKMVAALASGDTSAAALDYRSDYDASWAGKEMQRARNFRQGFHGGMIPGMINVGFHMFTGGAIPGGRKTMPADYEGLKPADRCAATAKVKTDDTLNLDILTDVYKSGSIHREEQAPHCKILDREACKKCYATYKSPCTRFCPAQVYEMEEDESGKFTGIKVNFSNCVHCKTCEIKDPMQNVRWTPPEGGDGPKYQKM